MKLLKNIRHSLITRLMLYFFVAGFVLIILFGINIAFGLKVHFKDEILPNIAQYLEYIKDDIGTPPDLIKAKLLSDKLSIKIQILGPDLNWRSNDSMQAISLLDFETAPYPYQNFKIAHRHQHNFVLLQVDEYQYYLSIGRIADSPSSMRNMVLIAVLISFMWLLFYLIRKSLKPLKTISLGINDIASGNLDSPIIVNNSLEFEQLADGINTMSHEIKSMLEAKEELLLAISHELRSPMTRAQVNLALLPEDNIQKALKHDLIEMEHLISQILESQRLNQTYSALNKTNFQLDELIHEIIQGYFQQNGVLLELSQVDIVADKTRMMLLIKNIIDNALKYSKETLKPPTIHLFEDGHLIVCEIKDFGIGIKQEDLKKITQAFYRIDKARQRSTGGFGLGLYLSQLIVKAHHGSIHFESKIGEGTTVTIKLPNTQYNNDSNKS